MGHTGIEAVGSISHETVHKRSICHLHTLGTHSVKSDKDYVFDPVRMGGAATQYYGCAGEKGDN